MSQASSAQWAVLPDLDAEIEVLRRSFRERYGSEPEGIWSAPGRLNLLGEYVDFNGGSCLPTPLPYRTLVAGRLRRDGILHAESLQMPEAREAPVADIAPGTVSGWFTYVGGVAWAMNREGGPDVALPMDFGADLLIDSTVPVGGGLSSSAALLSATALALLELSCPLRPGAEDGDGAAMPVGGCGPDNDALRARLVQVCMAAENQVAGARTGGLDHTAALRSLPGEAMVVDFRDFSIQALHVTPAEADLAFLVIDTRAPHDLADGQFSARRRVCEAVAQAAGVDRLRDLLPDRLGFPELDAEAAREAGRRVVDDAIAALEDSAAVREAVAPAVLGPETLDTWIRHVFTDMVLVERARTLFSERLPAEHATWTELGELFTASHASMRDNLQASREELDVAVRTCLDHGALGARLVGGGFGGAVLALVREENLRGTAEAVARSFAERGFARPVFLPLAPGRPANRER